MIRHANEQKQSENQELLDRIGQVIFIATPHSGSQLPVFVTKWSLLMRPTVIIKDLVVGEQHLLDLKRWYTNFCDPRERVIEHLVLREGKPTFGRIVVDEMSSDPGIAGQVFRAIDANHVEICKPAGRNDLVYGIVRDFLKKLSNAQPPAAVRGRSQRSIVHPEVLRKVPDFVGRDAELSAIDAELWAKGGRAALTNSSTAAAAAVRGMGGVGKSVMALVYAQRNRERYEGVWWIRAEKRETLIEDLIDLGRRLIEDLPDDRDKAPQLTIDHLSQTKSPKPWLLIYDNVEKPEDIAKLTPPTGAHVLITTRWSDWYGYATELPVDVFPRESAIDFLMAHARRADRDAAGRLAEDLGCLPLALAHARSYCWGMNWSFDQYRAKLPDLIRKSPRNASYPASVFATFDLALTHAAEQCPEAERLFGLFAFLAPDRIPLDLIPERVMSEIERGEAVAALAEVSLLEIHSAPDGPATVSVHRLVQAVMRGRLEEGGTHNEVAAEVMRLLEAGFDRSSSWEATKKNDALRPHMIAGYVHAKHHPAAELMIRWLQYDEALTTGHRGDSILRFDPLNRDNDFALRFYHRKRESLLELAKVDPANADFQRELSASHRSIGDVLRDQGKLPEALESYRTALAITGPLAKTEPNNLDRQHDLWALYNKLGTLLILSHSAEAVQCLRDGLAIAEGLAEKDPNNAYRQHHLSVSNYNVGTALVSQGKLGEGSNFIRAGLAIAERLAETDRYITGLWPHRSELYNVAGRVFALQGKLPEAITSFRSSLAIRDELAKANPDNASFRSMMSELHDSIGDALVAQGHLAEALQSFRDGLAVRDRLAQGNPDNVDRQRDLAVSHDKIGDALVVQGNLAEALVSFRDGLAIRDRLAKAEPDIIDLQRDLSVSHAKIGDALVTRGHFDEALVSFRDSLAIRDRLPKNYPDNIDRQRDLAECHDKVGEVLQAQGDLAEALQSFRDALAIRARLAKADPENAGSQILFSGSYYFVGCVLMAQGNLGEALTSFRSSLAIVHRLAKADPNTVSWQYMQPELHDNIGEALVAQGHLDEALESFRDGLAIRDRLAKADPDNVDRLHNLSVSQDNIGNVLAEQGNLPEALVAYKASLAIRERLAKADSANAERHGDLAASHGKLGQLLVRMDRREDALDMFGKGRAIVAPLMAATPDHAQWKKYLTLFDQDMAELAQK
jgi:tetratricopeptide (TPR) repeat protein